MKLLILFAAALLATTLASAETLQCNATLRMSKDMPMPVAVDFVAKTVTIKDKTGPIDLLETIKLVNVEKAAACAKKEDFETCLSEQIANLPKTHQMMMVIAATVEELQTDEESYGDLVPESKLAYKKVAAGRLIGIGEVKDLGQLGLYEYYDGKGKLLGRYLHGGLALMDCY